MIGFMIAALMAAGPVLDLPPETAALAALAGDEEAFAAAVRERDHELRREALQLRECAAVSQQTGDAQSGVRAQQEALRKLTALRETYAAALGVFGDQPRLLCYYGELLYDEFNDTPGAVQAWTKALSQDGDFPAANMNLGLHYCASGQMQMGLEYIDHALKLEPKNADFSYNLVQVYLAAPDAVGNVRGWDQGRVYKEMMRLSKSAAELAPDDFEVLQDYAVNFFAAENFGQEADWKAGAEAWRHARPFARGPNEAFFTWLNEARAWIWAGDDARAVRCLTESMRKHPGNESARLLLEDLKQGKSPRDERR